MKNILLLVFAFGLFTACSTISHEQRFLEVTASEEIAIKPNTFIYQISWENNPSMDMPRRYEDPSKDTVIPVPPITIDEVKMILDRGKYSYTLANENSYSINRYSSTKSVSINVSISSETELKALYDKLSDKVGISCKMENVKFDEVPSSYSEIVYKKLYEKAKTDAQRMAQISGVELGGLISVSEKSDPVSDIINSVSNMIGKSLSYSMIFGSNNAFAPKSIERKLVFRFAIK